MWECIEVELLLSFCHIEENRLFAIDTTETCGGIESTTTSRIIELHSSDIIRNVVCYAEAAKGDDTIKCQIHLYGLFTDRDIPVIEEGISEPKFVGELDSCEVGHRGISITTMRYDYQLIVTFFELEQLRNLCRSRKIRLSDMTSVIDLYTYGIKDLINPSLQF